MKKIFISVAIGSFLVFLLAAIPLADAGEMKWQQRPDMLHGVDIISTPDTDVAERYSVADDWYCLGGSPVTELHFWGSYPGLSENEPGPIAPPGGVDSFRIRIYSDAPATVDGLSHPDRLLYEAWVSSLQFTETDVASIPRPGGVYEHKFRYDLELPRIFWQQRGRVYWLSIAARTREGFSFFWGWENSMDRWNDCAVKGWYRDRYNWSWNVLKSPCLIDFDDLATGMSYPVGTTFFSSGIPVSVLPFQFSDGEWTSAGSAVVDNLTGAGGSGNEIHTDKVNIGFALPYPVADVLYLFGEYFGNVNLEVNGVLRNFENYRDIDSTDIDGVQVTATGGSGNDAGKVSLDGMVTSLAVGGQEHFVDKLSFSRFLDMAFELGSCKSPLKWLQLPDMADGIDIFSTAGHPAVADDFLCADGRPVRKVYFWGSYFDDRGHWVEDSSGPPLSTLPEPPSLPCFEFSFFKDVPAGADPNIPYSHPGELLYRADINPDGIEMHYWDSIPHADAAGHTWWEHKFFYVAELPEPFVQTEGEIYWLGIGALTSPESSWSWGWETSLDQWNDAAVSWVGDTWKELSGDMAFGLLTEDDTLYCRGDFIRDGDVDGMDLAVLAKDFNRTDCADTGDCEGDFLYDGDVDGDDLAVFAAEFGRPDCPCTYLPDCDDNNLCTEDYFDQATGSCLHLPISCDDGDPCTADYCYPTQGCISTARNCDDGILCTIDSCDPATGACSHVPDNSSCDDNDPCTVGVCDAATGCTQVPVCDDHDPCTVDSCSPDTGECVYTPVSCNDNNQCTVDSCDPDTGECVFTPVTCDDHDPCTVDSCDPEQGCIFTRITCNDHNQCTTDSCNPETQECEFIPVTCDDHDPCTIDSCDPEQGCIFTRITCNDNNQCTVDSCDPDTGECVFTPVTCDDHDPCTIDSCDPVQGCIFTRIICNDNNQCTVDSCDPDTGECVFTPVTCDDHDPCTVDSCDPEQGCIFTRITCNDHNQCTTDYCDPDTGECIYIPVTCDDNDPCTDDSCDPQLGCQFVNICQ